VNHPKSFVKSVPQLARAVLCVGQVLCALAQEIISSQLAYELNGVYDGIVRGSFTTHD
jgi:hypothetical protein